MGRPLTSFDKTGHFKWNDDLVAELENSAKHRTRRKPGGDFYGALGSNSPSFPLPLPTLFSDSAVCGGVVCGAVAGVV